MPTIEIESVKISPKPRLVVVMMGKDGIPIDYSSVRLEVPFETTLTITGPVSIDDDHLPDFEAKVAKYLTTVNTLVRDAWLAQVREVAKEIGWDGIGGLVGIARETEEALGV